MSLSVPPWVYPSWDSLCFLDLGECFLSHVREVFNYYLFKYFLRFFLSLFSSGIPIMRMLVCFMLSQRSLRPSSFLFILFSLFCSTALIFTILSSSSIIHYSASVILLLIPFRVFFISVFVLFISVCSLFLLGLCLTVLVSSQSVPPFFFRDLGLSLLSLLWILFQVDFLSPLCLVVLLGFYFISSSGTYSYAILFCSTFCDCGFHSAVCRVVGFLASAVCPQVDKVSKKPVHAFWWEGLVPLGAPPPTARPPQAGEPDVGLRTFTPVGELLWYNYFPVCGLPTWHIWDLILLWLHPSYCLTVASSLSLDVEYLFW